MATILTRSPPLDRGSPDLNRYQSRRADRPRPVRVVLAPDDKRYLSLRAPNVAVIECKRQMLNGG